MVWRYANLVDGAMLVFGSSFVSGALLLFRLFSFGGPADSHWLSLPLSVIVLEYLLVLCGVIGLRILRRTLYELNHHYQPWSRENRDASSSLVQGFPVQKHHKRLYATPSLNSSDL